MATEFSLEIKTPEKLIFSGDIESLIVEHPSGKEGYLAFHEPVLRELAPGMVQFSGERVAGKIPSDNPSILKTNSPKTFEIEIQGGFLSFEGNKAVVFIR
ncbi:MAG: hypothetical protein J6H21_05150 [Firmicutes bacterium]|nr:hypothetical protein [Bacillota bacterium]